MIDLQSGVYTPNTETKQNKNLFTFGPKLDEFIWRNILLQPDANTVKVMATSTEMNLKFLQDGSHPCILNLKRINHVRYVNKFLETANEKLPRHGYYISSVETKDQRVKNIRERFHWIFATFVCFIDFMFHRVLPKIPKIRKAYFWATRGQNRTLTLSETLGRLISCGFTIIDHKEIDGLTWFVARKTESPKFDLNPTYGPLVKLRRVGMGGKLINVYKLRTMHPYSEHMQEYLFNQNGTSNGDKINGDFRVASWGRILRRLWLDEIPMIYNLLKGELKLVGVRPLSYHKFKTYPEWLQIKRVTTKPGLVPPFYADCPETPADFFESESKYIDAYMKNPVKTDIAYFYKAMYNIFIKKARSG